MLAAVRDYIGTTLHERVRPALLGSDRSAVRTHLHVAALLTATVAVVTGLSRTLTVVVSPSVWDVFLLLSAVTLFGLTVANAYWEGGLLVGYTLVSAPTSAGLFVAYVGRGPFESFWRTLGFGVLLVAGVAIVVGTPGFVLGRSGRWIRERRRSAWERAS